MSIAPGTKDPIARSLAAAALCVAIVGTVFAMTASSPAKQAAAPAHDSKKKGKGKKRGPKLGARLAKLRVGCPIPNAADLGTWCLESAPYPVPPEDIAKVNYFYAAKACVKLGGWLPTAAQLIGAASRVKLQSTIDDNPVTSGAEEFPNAAYGIKDRREMTSDLFTTAPGDRAAGSEGVTPGSKGVGNLGEPDPVPMPAEPEPETLDYVTVYDNHNRGGFAGGAAVGKSENFRCAYAKGSQGRKLER